MREYDQPAENVHRYIDQKGHRIWGFFCSARTDTWWKFRTVAQRIWSIWLMKNQSWVYVNFGSVFRFMESCLESEFISLIVESKYPGNKWVHSFVQFEPKPCCEHITNIIYIQEIICLHFLCYLNISYPEFNFQTWFILKIKKIKNYRWS